MQAQFGASRENPQTSRRREGEVRIETPGKARRGNSDDGEYVDFTEIK